MRIIHYLHVHALCHISFISGVSHHICLKSRSALGAAWFLRVRVKVSLDFGNQTAFGDFQNFDFMHLVLILSIYDLKVINDKEKIKYFRYLLEFLSTITLNYSLP